MEQDFFKKPRMRARIKSAAGSIQTLDQIASGLGLDSKEFKTECFKNHKLFRIIIRAESDALDFEKNLYTKGYDNFLSKKIDKQKWDAINDRYKLFLKIFESMSLTFFVRKKNEKSFEIKPNIIYQKPVWSPECLKPALENMRKRVAEKKAKESKEKESVNNTKPSDNSTSEIEIKRDNPKPLVQKTYALN